MRKLKKYFGIIMGIVMAMAVLPAMPAYASGTVVVAVSASSLNIGEKVTITATAKGPGGEQTTATLGFSYDSSKFSFVSCSDSTYSGGGGGYVGVVAEKASITLKAEAAGSSSVTVSGSDGVIFATGEEIGALAAGGSGTITIKNSAGTGGGTGDNGNTTDTGDNANKSGDNSLASLVISPGTLSPAFKYSTTNYTASVGADVNEIAVDAKPSHAKATVESVTGNKNLQPGENTIKIVVKAENGTTATYKIVVTKGGNVETPTDTPTGENPDAIIINGHEYNLSATIPEDKLMEDFTKTTVTCRGQEVEALQFNNGNVVLVYLTTPDTDVKNMLAVYEQESGNLYPFVKIPQENNYYILLKAPEETGLSESYTPTTVQIGEYGALAAYTSEELQVGDFYLLYAISNTGTTGWYQYDNAEGTLQRYILREEASSVDEEALNADMKGMQNAYDKLEKQYNSEKSFARKTIAVLIFLIAVLIVVIVNLILHRKKDDDDEWEDGFSEVPKRFRKKEELTAEPEEEEKPKRKAPEKKIPEKKIPEKKMPEKKMPEKKVTDEDDFEVIDLDDL